MKTTRLLWCQHRDCRVGLATTETPPLQCPACGLEAAWTADAPVPFQPYILTPLDRAMLKDLNIAFE